MSPKRVVPLILAALTLAGPAAAQTPTDVRVTLSRTIEFGGSLGVIARFVPGIDEEQAETLSIDGARPVSRVDAGETSTIQDFGVGEIVVLNHEDESFYRFTFAEVLSSVSSGAAFAGTQPEQPMPEAEDGDVQYEVSVSVERPGRSREVGGAPTDLVRVFVRADPVRAQDVDPEELPSYVMVMDSWMAEDHPGAEAQRRLGEAAAEAFGEQAAFQDAGQGMAQALQMNLALRESYGEMVEELSQISGFPMEQTMAFVALMPDADLDLDAAMTGPIAGPDIDFGALARQGAVDAVQSAVTRGLGGLGGLFGGGRNDDPEPPAADAPQQAVIMRTTETMVDFTTGPLPADWFAVPAGYEERASPFAAGP
jgi:hypothetical protein